MKLQFEIVKKTKYTKSPLFKMFLTYKFTGGKKKTAGMLCHAVGIRDFQFAHQLYSVLPERSAQCTEAQSRKYRNEKSSLET